MSRNVLKGFVASAEEWFRVGEPRKVDSRRFGAEKIRTQEIVHFLVFVSMCVREKAEKSQITGPSSLQEEISEIHKILKKRKFLCFRF